MRELLAILLSLLAAAAAATVIWLWWRSPIPTFLVFTPVLHGMLLGVALHYLGVALRVTRSPRWVYVAAIAGYLSVIGLMWGQYISDAYAHREQTRRAVGQMMPIFGLPPRPGMRGVLDEYDHSVLLPATGRTGMWGYAKFQNRRRPGRGWLRFGEALIVVITTAAIATRQRETNAEPRL